MDSSLILSNILNPPVLFFFLGMIAVFVQSDLEIPNPLPKLFSLYLLVAIGFKGGHELLESGLSSSIIVTLLAAILMLSRSDTGKRSEIEVVEGLRFGSRTRSALLQST